MIEVMSMAMDSFTVEAYGGVDGIERAVREAGCTGCEMIWGGEPLPEKLPCPGNNGYHLVFFPDWLDFWKEDREALCRKMGNMETVRTFYGGFGREFLIDMYRQDMRRAEAAGALYAVFHVSDVSIEEGYTYRWLHTHEEVIDAAAELINILTDEHSYPFDILLENQWWPGFTFTEPRLTGRLLDKVRTDRKGIVLDIGHLMNTNTALRTQSEGAEYVLKMLDRHGELSKLVKGLHLHQSLSGEYVEKNTGALPPLPEDYFDRFGVNYSHILKIDTHSPWTDSTVKTIIERVRPAYINHELSEKDPKKKVTAVKRQRRAMLGG